MLPDRLANPPTGMRKHFDTFAPVLPTRSISDARRPGNRPEFIFGRPSEPAVVKSKPTVSVFGVVKTGPPEDIVKEKKKVPMDGPMNQVRVAISSVTKEGESGAFASGIKF